MKKYVALSLLVPSFLVQASFSDVSTDFSYHDALEKLKQDEVITGYDDGSYRPKNRINRAEFVTLLMRASGEDLSGEGCFPDVKNQWFAASVCTAKTLGILDGYQDGYFRPEQYINVAEASKIVTQVFEKTEDLSFSQDWFEPFLVSLESAKAIPLSVQAPDQFLNRGEMAEIIWRLRENITEKPSQKAATLTQDLPTYESCAMLEQSLLENKNNSGYMPRPGIMPIDGVFIQEDMALGSVAAPMARNQSSSVQKTTTASDSSYTETNVQVKGVDEADIIKTDGEYIYYIQENNLFIVKASPANQLEIVSKKTIEGMSIQEMLLHDDQLVLLGQEHESIRPYAEEPRILEKQEAVSDEMLPSLRMIAPYPPYYQKAKTKVLVFDIKDKKNMVLSKSFSFDGNYQTVRRIEDALYLVLNHNLWFWGGPMPLAKDILPTFRVDSGQDQSITDCTSLRYIPGQHPQQWTNVIGIDLLNLEEEPDQEVIIGGSASTVYASLDHLYIATPWFDSSLYPDWDWEKDNTKTVLFQFSLNDGQVAFEKKGSAPGTLLNQFSLDEHKNHLRVATTTRGKTMANHVFILNENMEVVGNIQDIAPDEQIYSTRFMGDRLYMVTFRTIDPLFVIDLSVPEKPTILGKLKIPGFSNYLHPFDENHIIGFGKDTEESKDGTFAWQQGMKIALFDVSDVNNPLEKHQILIGDRGTDSELLFNHKALMWDNERKLIGFPISIAKVSGEPKEWEDERSRYGTTSFVGAHVYEVSEKEGFLLKAAITHYTLEDVLKMGDYWPYEWNKNIQRILSIGETLYTASPSMIKATNFVSGKEEKSIPLE